MIFLAPGFLFGLTALVIPIIIHLFNFRKAKRVYFSNNKFLKKVNEVSSSKRKLKHFLVLFSRIFFLLFLVLTFAQPFIPSNEESLAPNVIIYFDNSHSMSNESDIEKSAFEQGLFFVNEIVKVYPRDTKFKLITNDFSPFSNIYRTSNEIFELITELDYSNITRTNTEIFERIRSEKVENVDVYWISDFQKSSIVSNSTIDSSMNFRIYPLSYTANKNIYIDSVFVSNPYSSAPKFNFIIRNTGLELQSGVSFQFYVNDLQVSSQVISIPGRGKVDLVIDYNRPIENQVFGKVTIEDFPITFDNEFFFVLNPLGNVNILEIKERNEKTSLQNVYGNGDLFAFESVQVDRLNYNQINERDVILLNGLETITSALSITLNEFVEKGGTLVLIPSENIQLESYASIPGLRNFKKLNAQAMLPMETPDYNNPFYENVFEEKNNSIKMPQALPVLGGGDDRDAFLKFKNGQSFLTNAASQSRIFVFASPFDNIYTDFHYHALFVPLMYKIVI